MSVCYSWWLSHYPGRVIGLPRKSDLPEPIRHLTPGRRGCDVAIAGSTQCKTFQKRGTAPAPPMPDRMRPHPLLTSVQNGATFPENAWVSRKANIGIARLPHQHGEPKNTVSYVAMFSTPGMVRHASEPRPLPATSKVLPLIHHPRISLPVRATQPRSVGSVQSASTGHLPERQLRATETSARYCGRLSNTAFTTGIAEKTLGQPV
jgi:hypothetical protein